MHKPTAGRARMPLDAMGTYYTSTFTPETAASFYTTTHLREAVNPAVLQEAANEIIAAFPHLSGRPVRTRFRHFHELIPEPPTVQPETAVTPFENFITDEPGHALRVLYGPTSITVETTHTLCDGRALSEISRALTVAYVRRAAAVMGRPMDDGPTGTVLDAPDLHGSVRNAYQAATATPKVPSSSKPGTPTAPEDALIGASTKITAYHPSVEKAPSLVTVYRFDLAAVKAAARRHDATINTYLLARIFDAYRVEREAEGNAHTICAEVPVDGRPFVGFSTLRNMVASAGVRMPEGVGFDGIVRGLSRQLAHIDAAWVRREAVTMHRLMSALGILTARGKERLIGRMAARFDASRTTMLSNVGLARFPADVVEPVTAVDFVLDNHSPMAFVFACWSVGNVLSLSVTSNTRDMSIPERLVAAIRDDGGAALTSVE